MGHEVKQALVLGRESYRRGDYAEAEHFLRQVVEREEGYADVFDMLGVIAYRRGDFGRAEGCFRRAVALNADYTQAQLNLVITCNELGRYDEAREIYARLCARRSPAEQDRDGRIANLHARTAEAYEEADRLDDAIEELDKALRLGPGFVDLRVKLAQLLRKAGHAERAENQYRAALEHNPRYVDAYLGLCDALLAAGRPADALEVLDRLRHVDPESRRAQTYERVARRSLAAASG